MATGNGYGAARQFYGLAARERLDRIAEETKQLRRTIEASNGRPPAELLRYLDTVTSNATASEWLRL